MIHDMKLQKNPFNLIKLGTKTIEMRLNDEKRRKIKVGDEIVFTNVTNNETIRACVIELYKFDSFENLYNSFDKVSIGYDFNEEANPNDMKKYYNDENIKKYGVLAIEIKLIK